MRANIAWDVYLDDTYIDTVFYTPDCNAEYVRKSLIDHDHYNPRITVRKAK